MYHYVMFGRMSLGDILPSWGREHSPQLGEWDILVSFSQLKENCV